jgi:putative hydrolase of the HAD superfamily
MALGRVKAVLLDALGTLVQLVQPWPALVAQLAARGIDVGEREARDALLEEMRHYRERCHIAHDRATLARLRAECTEVLRGALPPRARALPPAELQDALLGSLRFRPYPEVPAVLEELGAAGVRRVVVSNWDVSLHDVLATTGLDVLLDGVVTSAETGSSKPDPAIFAAGLAVADARADEALHAGDSVDADVAGALAAGIAPVLVAREEWDAEAPRGVRVIRSLDGLLGLAS